MAKANQKLDDDSSMNGSATKKEKKKPTSVKKKELSSDNESDTDSTKVKFSEMSDIHDIPNRDEEKEMDIEAERDEQHTIRLNRHQRVMENLRRMKDTA